MLKGSCLVCGKQECRAEHRAAPPKRVMTPTIATQPAPKRLCVQSAVSPTPSTATPSRNQSSATIPICTRVCILGREYSTLKWHLGKKTNDSQLERAANHGFSRAIELSGGDTHTLKSRELVSSSAARPPELLPGRQNLPTTWMQSICPAARSGGKDFVWMRRATDPSKFRQVLLPCDELAKVFENKSVRQYDVYTNDRRPPKQHRGFSKLTGPWGL